LFNGQLTGNQQELWCAESKKNEVESIVVVCEMLITMCKSADVETNMKNLCKHVGKVRAKYEKACSMMLKSESIKHILEQLPYQSRVFKILQGVVKSTGTDLVPFSHDDLVVFEHDDHTVIQASHVTQHSGGQQQPQRPEDHEPQSCIIYAKWLYCHISGMHM